LQSEINARIPGTIYGSITNWLYQYSENVKDIVIDMKRRSWQVGQSCVPAQRQTVQTLQ